MSFVAYFKTLARYALAALLLGFPFVSGAVDKSTNADAKSLKQPLPVVMFKINDDEITVAEYAQFLQGNPKLISQAFDTDAGKAAAVREMAANYLLRKALYDEKLLTAKKEPERKEILAAYEELAKRHFPVPPDPDDKTAYQYYLDHPEKYGIPRQVRLDQILFAVPKGADERVKASVRERAEGILKRLQGGESFQELAVAHTANPVGKLTQGDIGYVSPDQQPWLNTAVKDKKSGDLLGLVESPEGFEILRVTDDRPAITTPFANVRASVIKDLKDQEQTKMRSAYVKDLAKGVKWEIVEPTLKPIMKDGLFP